MIKVLLKRYGLWPTVAATTLAATMASAAISATIHYPLLGIGMTPVAWLITLLCPILISPLMSGITLHLLLELERAHERLRVMNDSDHLTGLFNRRYFMNRLSGELERTARYGGTFSVAFVDIDDFKGVNDAFGHLGGDEVLRRLAETCSGCMRETDTFARIGGEEFALLMPETEGGEAHRLLERLRAAVEATRITLPEQVLRVTISVGVVTNNGKPVELNRILRLADEALYDAKRRGKNRVVSGPAETPPTRVASAATL